MAPSTSSTSERRRYSAYRQPSHLQAPRSALIELCAPELQRMSDSETFCNTNTWSDWAKNKLLQSYHTCWAVFRSRTVRKWSVVFICASVIASFAGFIWILQISPSIKDSRAAADSLQDSETRALEGVFGEIGQRELPGMTLVANLDSNLLPRGTYSRHTSSRDMRRLIFIGDIHGCQEELAALLRKVRFDPDLDHIIVTGDMINKGPDSLGVIDLLREKGASCVRGNHEDRILFLADQMKSALYSDGFRKHNQPHFDYLDEASASPSDAQETTLARSLGPKQLSYLKSCPVILRVGLMKALGGQVVAVHGGLVPGVPLERQDPSSVMNMRIMNPKSHTPSKYHERKGSVPWTEVWNTYQKLLPTRRSWFSAVNLEAERLKGIHTTVVYGHNSHRGLQMEEYTKGLDSGCYKGGRLTALVMTDGGQQKLIQVDCKDHRSDEAAQSEVHIHADDVVTSQSA